MKIMTLAASGLMMIALSAVPVLAANENSASPDVASLLNKANQMNNEEQDMASMLYSKAGDNQALMTMATTIKEDHKANEEALKALATQKNVTLNSYNKNDAKHDQMNNMKGADFDKAFLDDAIKDHRQALQEFEQMGRSTNDRDVKVYVDQTIPVLEAHLKMAENMRHDDSKMGSPENPVNNKRESSNR